MTKKLNSIAFILIILTAISTASIAIENRSSPRHSSSSDNTVHPTPENIPDDDEVVDLIKKNERSKDLEGEVEGLRNAKEILIIGVKEGESDEIIGKVEDVKAAPEGYIYLLDSRYNEVRVYNPFGDLVQTFGKPGRGPDELMAPTTLMESDRGDVIVADGARQVKVFDRDRSSFKHRKTIRLGVGLDDMCLNNQNELFVFGYDERKTIHSFSLADEEYSFDKVESFGTYYRDDDELVRSNMSIGLIGCGQDGIVYTLKFLPVLYGHMRNGEGAWKTKLSDFSTIKATEVTVGGRKGLRFETGDVGYHDTVVSLTTIPGGRVIFQTARQTTQSIKEGREYAELFTYVIDIQTGQGAYVGNHLPPIYDATSKKLYTGVNAPFPQVKIYQYAYAGGSAE